MHEQEDLRPPNKFIYRITSAYDLSSCGMGIFLNAVRLLNSGKYLSKYNRDALSTFGSNYIVNPYILTWLRPEQRLPNEDTPKNLSSAADQHKKLLLETQNEYDRLEWDVLRLALSGQDNEQFKQSGLPLSKDELPAFLQEALKNGYILGDSKKIDKIEENKTVLQFLNDFFRADFDFDDKRFKQYTNMFFNKKFKGKLTKASVHKLGSMLAITDLITYDAAKSGTPIPFDFKPERFDKGWRKVFGKPVPCIGDLYAEAYEVFRNVADPMDPLIAHLFSFQSLPQMAKK